MTSLSHFCKASAAGDNVVDDVSLREDGGGDVLLMGAYNICIQSPKYLSALGMLSTFMPFFKEYGFRI